MTRKLWKGIAATLIGFMAFGASASALSVDDVRFYEGTGGRCLDLADPIVKTISFDLTVTPFTTLLISSTPTGTGTVGIYGRFMISVQHADQTTATGVYTYTRAPHCEPASDPAADVTGVFKPGLNIVTITLVGMDATHGHFDWRSPNLYLVAQGGHAVSTAL